MTTKTASTGDWETAGTWSPSGAPTASDLAVIPDGAIVTTTVTDDVAHDIYIQYGGKLQLGAGLTLKMGNGIYSQATASLISLGTAASPTIIDSVAPPATWFMVLTEPGSDTVLDYLLLKNNLWTLGYDTSNFILTNRPTVADSSYINIRSPLTRASMIVNHPIPMRSAGRTYPNGNQAGTLTIAGFLYYSSFDYMTLLKLQTLNLPLSLFTDQIHLRSCLIQGDIKYSPKAGQLWCPFSMTLIECV